MRARIKDLTISLKGEQNLTFTLLKGEDARQLFDNLNEKELELTIKKYYPKRSLQANRYCWKLIGEIAKAIRTTNEEVYIQMLIDYGQTDLLRIKKSVDISRYVDYYKLLESDNETNTYLIAIGSSKYNSSEMHRLIEGVVDTAKSLDIEVLTPDEIANMTSLWKGE